MNKESYDDSDLVRMLRATQTIAVVGASTNPARHSHRVMAYMQHFGYSVVPVNPGAAGKQILGVSVAASLAEVPAPIDMVDVFRRQDAIPGVFDEVISLHREKRINYLWLQLDLYDEDGARRARDMGLEVVMDRCLKIEFGRLLSHGG